MLTADQKKARAIAKDTRWRRQRGDIPNDYPGWEDASEAEHCLPLEGFAPLDNQEIFNRIRDVLTEEPKFRRLFVRIGQVLGCKPEAVCLVEPRGGVIRGRAAAGKGFAFRFPYNPPAASVLKDAGSAIYSKTPSRWTVPVDDDGMGTLQGLQDHFHIMIDLSSLAIQINARDPVAPTLQ